VTLYAGIFDPTLANLDALLPVVDAPSPRR